MSQSSITPFVRVLKRSRQFAAVTAALLLVGGVTQLNAKPIPDNLGNGLGKLVESNVMLQQAKGSRVKTETFASSNGKVYATEQAAGIAGLALTDGGDRLLVRIYPNGFINIDSLIKNLGSRVASFSVTAVDRKYNGIGVMNAFVSVDDVAVLAGTAGVRLVVLELRPRHNKAATPTVQQRPVKPNASPGEVITLLGTYTDQGVFQHRIDQINQFYNPSAPRDLEGSGLSIACISNSFNANTTHPATLDVTNFDLPGDPANPRNTTPVFVIQDDLSSATSDDEGRGMCQIVYKMAPKAKVGFGTADSGEVGFANNIRGLAGLPGFTIPGQTFAADVICDDVGYFDEPFYEDGIIGAGVNDVAAAGVSYFSSAANDVGINGYESDIRLVANSGGLTAATNPALAGTNINLAGVPTNLYAGGFHNFNPNPGQLDVAQTVNVAVNNTVPTVLQWNDPYDQNSGITLTGQIYQNTGTYVNAPVVFDQTSTPPLPQLVAGQAYSVIEQATNGANYDAIVTIINPDGTTLLTQDTGVDETVNFTAPTSGQYKISFDHFGTTTGSFTFTVNTATVTQYVISDWNLLAFRTDTGAYVPASSLTTNNVATNQPIEIGFVNRTSAAVTSIQYVFALSNSPLPGARFANKIRYLIPANGRAGYGPAEYFTYNTVTTSGHATAQGCNGTAAYSCFRPNIPEAYSSPGPATIYFDVNHVPLATPEVRLQPRIAAMDAGNVSANEGLAGLGADSGSDFDVAANFSGTSAAAPHAAACALLVLEANGGRFSVTPTQMTSLLQKTTFAHDLDPNFSSASVRATNGGKVNITFSSDNSSNNGGTGLLDTNSLAVAYVGPSFITSLVFNPNGLAAEGGAVTAGNNGLDVTQAYFTNVYPGVVWNPVTKAFTVGATSVGLAAADATAVFSNVAGLPSAAGQTWTMALNFPNNNFTGGKILKFTVGRQIQHSSSLAGTVAGAGPTGGTTSSNFSADLFGGGVLIPEGTVTNTGMRFTGTLGDGSTFVGTIQNRIGAGWSKLDGYGFINCEAAVNAPLN